MREPNNQGETPASSTRSHLFIDLNESPVSSTSSPHAQPDLDFVYDSNSYKSQVFTNQDHDPFSEGACAPLCGICGMPEANGDVVVCDGCERGFHLACAGLEGVRETCVLTDWLCSDCLEAGVSSKRWPLGVKDKRILDINCSPPSDIDTEAPSPELLLDSTDNHFPQRGQFSGDLLKEDAPHQCSEEIKGFKHSASVYKIGFEGTFRTKKIDVKELSHEGNCEDDNTGRQSSRSLSDILLRSLKQFISERNYNLEDGWSVEFKHSDGNCENSVIYCSPDGKTFGSMAEVAFHLGLVGCILDGYCTRDDNSCLPKAIKLPKKRKSRQRKVNDGSSENKESINGICRDSLSSTNLTSTTTSYVDLTEPSCDPFPVQFEDYYILSMGRVDSRSSYHEPSAIWPVEFKSFWHDKITRSVFVCEVLEGSDDKPLFKIRRVPCSAFSIPNGCTVLTPSRVTGEKVVGKTYHNLGPESDDSIEVFLARTTPPNESDVLSCLQEFSNEQCVQKKSSSKTTIIDTSFCDHFAWNSNCDDEVGDLYVEESSSSLAWKVIAQKLVNAFRNLCTKGRVLKFFCDHVDHNVPLWVIESRNNKGIFHPLTKFSSYPCTFNIPIVHQGDLDPLSSNLVQWLEEDRFGFDCEFVQEIIERLLEINECPDYQPLAERFHCSEFLTVANRYLNSESAYKFDGVKKPKLNVGSVMNNRFPHGNLTLTRFPVKFAGDLCQIWETLRRFHKVLGLVAPFSLSQLEAEMINPSFDASNTSEKCCGNFTTYEPNDFRCGDQVNLTGSTSCNLTSALEGHFHTKFENVARIEAGDRLPFMVNVQYFGALLSKAHSSLANVLISELQSKAAALVNPNVCLGESKSRKGRRKDVNYSALGGRSTINLLPINELTWPEVVRRYILSFLSISGSLDSVENIARECSRVYSCLGGDGGVLCGSLTGVAGMEADALFLADATKQIFGSLSTEKDTFMVEDDPKSSIDDCEKYVHGNIPEWAQELEPVKKLPTNVGTRIRKCVQNALEKCPPEWAKKRLEHCISKDVYKGNASGPTKKVVLAVLSEVLSEGKQTTIDKTVKKIHVPMSDVLMRRCRLVLRQAASVDEDKSFCTLLGRLIVASGDHSDEGLLGSPAFVSRPLDFRIIDHRLAAGAYGGSYESFAEDVRELWSNVHTAFGDQPDVIDLADKLFQKFESLYDTEVLALARKLEDYSKLDQINDDIQNDITGILASTDRFPRAPWDEGLCKVCGIDRDDESVLLCDSCDGEYHTYCLVPPLSRIPEGNWYCPSCTHPSYNFSRSGECMSHHCDKMYRSESESVYLKQIACLANAMEEKEYWELSVEERVYLLKFLSDELVNSALIRQHLELCSESAGELQQKLRSLYNELKVISSMEDSVSVRTTGFDLVTDGLEGKEASYFSRESKPQTVGSDLDPINATCCNWQNVYAKRTDNDDSEQNEESYAKHNEPNQSNGMICAVNKPYDEVLRLTGKNTSIIPSSTQRGSKDTTSVYFDDLHNDLELVTTKVEMLKLQKSIRKIEYKLLALSLRKEFLGSDSEGRLYWASLTQDNCPLIIVDGTISLHQMYELDSVNQYPDLSFMSSQNLDIEESKACLLSHYESCGTATVRSWFFYTKDVEIQELVGWLRDFNSREKALKEAIVQWMKSRFKEPPPWENENQQKRVETLSTISSNGDNDESSNLFTRASMVLKKKYGLILELDHIDMISSGRTERIMSKEKLYRCICLEPIWFSRYHCDACHRTFTDDNEFERHHCGDCHADPSGILKGKHNLHDAEGIVKDCRNTLNMVKLSKSNGLDKKNRLEGSGSFEAPFNFEEISTKFQTQDSIKALVHNIGLLDSHGVPSLLSFPIASETSALMVHTNKYAEVLCVMPDDLKERIECQSDRAVDNISGVIDAHVPNKSATEKGFGKFSSLTCNDRSQNSFSDINLDQTNCYSIIPRSALQPVVGGALRVLRQLKINLLDMEAALTSEAFKLSKAQPEKKWAWRAYVKSASSIYQMILATILLEDMINSQYLKNEWWHWSSITAAVKTSTVSSLALRIYSLDAAILYEKCFNIPASDTMDKPVDMIDCDEKYGTISETTEKCRIIRKSTRKRKEAEGLFAVE